MTQYMLAIIFYVNGVEDSSTIPFDTTGSATWQFVLDNADARPVIETAVAVAAEE